MRGKTREGNVRDSESKGCVIVVHDADHFLATSSQSDLTPVVPFVQSVSQLACLPATSRAEVVSVVADLPSMEIQLPRREHYASQLYHYDRQKRDPAAVPPSRNDAWLCNAGGGYWVK